MLKKEGKQTGISPLEQNEEHFNIIQKLTNLGSWRVDLDSATLFASAEACRIYGIEHHNYPLTYIQSLVMPDYRPELNAALNRLITTGSGYDVEYQIKRVSDGEIRDIHTIAEYNPEKRIVTGAIHDITMRKYAERALQESESRYRRLFDNSVSGIIYADVEGNVLDVNPKMLQILGSPSLAATKKVNVLTFPLLVEAGFSEDFRKVIATSDVVNGFTRYHSKWGKDHYLEYVLNPVKKEGTILRIIGKIEDITERKLADEKVQSLLEEKDLLLREVHHRLKNNMASIENLLKIQLGSSDDERVTAPLLDAASRLGSMRVMYDRLFLSTDLIHISIDDYFSTLADEIFEVFPESHDVEIIKKIQSFMIPSDIIFPLGLMINELLTNAFKYAFTCSVQEKRIRISAAINEGRVIISVSDNGAGYPEKGDSEEDPGFGLQLVRMLSKQIGGNVDFKNDGGAVCMLEFGIK
jgi:PAS domain S-box-containing protein